MTKIVAVALASVAALAARIKAPSTGGALKTLTKTLDQLEAVAVHHKAQIEKHDASVEKARAVKAAGFRKVDEQWSATLGKAEALEDKAKEIRAAASNKADAADAVIRSKFEASVTKATDAKNAAQAEADRATKVSERLAALLA